MPTNPDKDSLVALTAAMHAFVERKGWYAADSKRPQTPRNLAVSLSLEANEVLELFQWGETASPEALADELADVMLYLMQLASISDVDLGQAVLDKLARNQQRTWDGDAAK